MIEKSHGSMYHTERAQVREMTVLFPFLPCAGETVWPPSAKIFLQGISFSRHGTPPEGIRGRVPPFCPNAACSPAGRGACKPEKMVRSVRRKGGSCLRMPFRLRGNVRSCRSTDTGKDSRRRSAGRYPQRQGESVFFGRTPRKHGLQFFQHAFRRDARDAGIVFRAGA